MNLVNDDSFSDLSAGNLDLEQILQSSDDDDDLQEEIVATPSSKQIEEKQKKEQVQDNQQKVFSQLIEAQNDQLTYNILGGGKEEYQDILRRKRKQKEEEEALLQAEREMKENKLNAINPLDLIDQEQGQIMNNDNQLFQNFEKELILSRAKLPDDYNMEYSSLESISSYLYPQIGVEQEFRNNKNYGLPKAICILPNKLIIIGTSYGMVVMFDINTYKITQVIGTFDDYRKYGSVSSIDVNKEGDAILIGFEKGTISLFETFSGKCIKQILGVHESTILVAKYWKGRERFISSDLAGNIFLFKVEWKWLDYTFDKQRLLKKAELPSEIIYNIEILQDKHCFNSELSRINSTIVALCTATSVVIICLEPVVKKLYEIERPNLLQPALPCVAWGKGRAPYQTMDNMDFPILAVGWGPLIQLYQMNKMIVMQITSQQNVISEGFDIVGHLVIDHSIFYMQWISFSMIYLLNSRNELRIIYSGETVGGAYQGDLTSSDNLSINSTSETKLPSKSNIGSTNTLNSTHHKHQKPYVKHNYLIEQEINFMFVIKDLQNKLKRTFNNSIVVCNSDIFILTSKDIVRGHFFEWKECVFKYIKKKDWVIALKIAVMLQHGSLQSFAKLPDKIDSAQKKDFNETCEKLFLSYLEKEKNRIENYVPNSDKQEETWRFSKICFEYLIETRDFETLFKDARRCIMELDSNEAFHALLEPFILKHKIKRIPKEYFNFALKFFLEKKKFNVVQIMIVNLDLNSIDQYETLKQCVEYQLFTPLIYISTRKDNDFISSLEKMYNEYQTALREQGVKKNIEKYVYRCLWFIRLTLQQKLYPNDQIEENKFPSALRTVVSWFFSDQVIIDFAKVDSAVYFEVVYLLFVGKPANILREKDQLLFRYFLYDSEQKDQNVIQYPNFVHEQMIKKIYKILKPVINKNEKIKKDFYYFVGRVAHFIDIPIDLGVCKDSAEFLLQDNSFVSTEKEIQIKQSNILALVKRMRKQQLLLQGLIELIPQIDKLNDQMIDTVQQQYEDKVKLLKQQNDPDYKKKVQQMVDEFNAIQKKRFVQEKVDLEIFAYCQYLVGNLYQAFQQYQRMMEQSSLRVNRYKIFTWLYEAFKSDDLSEQEKEQLKGYVIDNIKSMILTSTRYTKNIVHNFMKEKEEKIFESLLTEQTLLLDYLECIMEDRKKAWAFPSPSSSMPSSQLAYQSLYLNSGIQNQKDAQQALQPINEETLTLYIALLCKVDPSRVVQELKTNFYPLEKINIVCRINHAYDAVAYLCEKQGNFQEAIQLYSRIFLEESTKTFQRIAKGRFSQQDKSKIKQNDTPANQQSLLSYAATTSITQLQHVLGIKFQQLIDSCISYSKSQSNNQEIWINMANDILSCKEAPSEGKSLWQDIANYINQKKESYEVVNQIFSNIVAQLFIEISNYVSIQGIIKLVQDYQSQFSFQSIKDSFCQILTTLSEEIVFLQEGKEVLLQDVIKQNLNFIKKTTQGNSYGVFCSHPQCQNHIKNFSSDIVVFTCKHQYHQRCLDIYDSFNHHKKRKNTQNLQAGAQNSQPQNKVYLCTICMKEEFPYLQQIEYEQKQVSQKLQNNNTNTNIINNTEQDLNSQINNLNLNREAGYSSSQYQESQKDSQSVITDKSNKIDIKDIIRKYREDQQKRLKIFDKLMQNDMDNFEQIRRQYENYY
ncbi:hypothetical protein ABPG72_007699 [Tetrahymena utriculariae]